jgi:hypothetical protein
MTWSLPERVIIACIETKGHALKLDNSKGWVTCTQCRTSWWVTRRADLMGMEADAYQDNDDVSSAPLDIKACSHPRNVSPT